MAALKKLLPYVRHRSWCPTEWHPTRSDCTCGLTELMTELQALIQAEPPRIHTECVRMCGTGPCACLDGCGACDSCGTWLGPPASELAPAD